MGGSLHHPGHAACMTATMQLSWRCRPRRQLWLHQSPHRFSHRLTDSPTDSGRASRPKRAQLPSQHQVHCMGVGDQVGWLVVGAEAGDDKVLLPVAWTSWRILRLTQGCKAGPLEAARLHSGAPTPAPWASGHQCLRFNSNALLKKNCLELQGRFKTLKYMSQNSVLKGPHNGVNFGK